MIKMVRASCHPVDVDIAHLYAGIFRRPTHFTLMASTLVSQIFVAAQSDLHAELIPTVVQLAITTDSLTHHRELNSLLMKHTQSEHSSIRLASVQCERALTDQVGKEWLDLLPEMLPILSELQEDDDELVEKETSWWIQRIEEILGERLDPMLQ